VQTLDDLVPGMQLQGTVTNVVAFGAFVDVGVHQDGLVHVSELADRYVQDPNAVVRVGDRVTVRVLSVDLPRKRIALSMKRVACPDFRTRPASFATASEVFSFRLVAMAYSRCSVERDVLARFK
jgi:protein Tex